MERCETTEAPMFCWWHCHWYNYFEKLVLPTKVAELFTKGSTCTPHYPAGSLPSISEMHIYVHQKTCIKSAH